MNKIEPKYTRVMKNVFFDKRGILKRVNDIPHISGCDCGLCILGKAGFRCVDTGGKGLHKDDFIALVEFARLRLKRKLK